MSYGCQWMMLASCWVRGDGVVGEISAVHHAHPEGARGLQTHQLPEPFRAGELLLWPEAKREGRESWDGLRDWKWWCFTCLWWPWSQVDQAGTCGRERLSCCQLACAPPTSKHCSKFIIALLCSTSTLTGCIVLNKEVILLVWKYP